MASPDGSVVRVPPIDPGAMSAEQLRVSDAIVSGPRGSVRGPLAVWLHNPGLAEYAQTLGAYCRFGTVLPRRLSELAIIVTAAHWRAGYEWRSHAPMAIEAGVAKDAVEAIRSNAPPAFARADEAVVHQFTVELLGRQRVAAETWTATEAELGRHGVIDLIGILGYYALVSMTINACELGGRPGEHNDPFQ